MDILSPVGALTMRTAAICFISSFLLNSLLLFLLNNTKKIIGNYRFLLIVYSCFLMSYNFLDFLMLPAVHIYKSGFIYLATSSLRHRPIGSIMAVLQSLSQCLCMSLLSFNFLFRYSIVHSNGWARYWYIWPIVTGIIITIWLTAGVLFVMPCDYFDWYFRDSVMNKYGVDTLDTGYYAVVYLIENPESGNMDYYFPSVFCLGLVAVCQLITGSLIGFCGFYLYKSIKMASHFASGVMAKVHKDLFVTLVLQTITPCLMVYVPGFILIVAPLLDIDANRIRIEEFQPLLISVFPIIDTLIVLVCFKGFRTALKSKSVL
uniref:G protein-coupled receptor n=1 Tax=Caenorhabditis tropicalis TaxID=1561998 RepID=A0A1I7UVK4_9PELO